MDVKEITEKAEAAKSKVEEALKKTDIDDKIKANSGKIKDEVKKVLDKTDIDDKIKEKAQDALGKLKKSN